MISSPQHPEPLKSAAKICMYKTGLAFFLLLGRTEAGWGRAFRGSRDGASPPSPGERVRGPGLRAGPGAAAAAAGLPRGLGRGWRPIRRAPGIQECAGCWPLPGFCVLRKASVHLHVSKRR